MSAQSKLNPETVSFSGNGVLISKEYRWSTIASTVPNKVFYGVLKLGRFCNGSAWPDVDVEIVKGPSEFVGKKAEVKAKYVTEAMESNTLLSDTLGYYIEGQWVFVKRGQRVRLDKYEA